MLRNTRHRYGLAAILFHWLSAVTIIGLFILGLWMVGLDYYDPWYNKAPDIHRSIGVLLGILIVVRILHRLLNPPPPPLPTTRRGEALAAKAAHWTLYGLILSVILSGYLMSTADGRAVSVFGWFSLPASLTGLDRQEDLAGDIHLILAITLVSLAGCHALAALKHHFINRDATLLRMLGRGDTNTNQDPLR